MQQQNDPAVREGRFDERGIFSNNFGGLNTIASDINCPYTDSPLLYNVDTLISGQLQKRKGTKLLATQEVTASNTTGYGIIPFTTGLKYDFLVEKVGTGLTIYEVDDDSVTSVMTKANVWDSFGATQKPNFTRTSELEPRIIIATGLNQPVQLRWVERQAVSTVTTTSIDITNATQFVNATTSNLIVYKNRVRQTLSGASYSSGTLTLTFGSNLAVDDVIDVILVTWQHMVEAIYLTGDRISQQVTRGNTNLTDQNVEIPERLRVDPIYNYPSSEFQYGLYAYQTSAWNDKFTFDSALTPATATEYCFGTGARYDSTAGGKVNPAPLVATFGALVAGSNPTEVMFIRQHDLNLWLNGGVDLAGDNLKVYSDDTLLTQSTTSGASSGTFRQFWLVDSTGSVVTATSTVGRFITWEASADIGIEEDANVYIIHTSTNFIGSGANADVEDYKDGACEPLFGIGKFCDYFRGSFPSNVTIFDNRLVFSGISSNPLKILFSEVGDTTVPLRPYRKFQIETLSSLSTDAFDLSISGAVDDYINGLASWQSSLLIFSRQTVYRLFSTQGGISNATASLSLISTTGLVNSYSVKQASSNVYFLSDIGVFKIMLGVDSSDFRLVEISSKIRNEFGITANPTYETQSFLGYDQVTEKLYVGYPREGETQYCTRLFVLNVFREAWTEYLSCSYFRVFQGIQYEDFSLGKNFLLACSIAGDVKKGFLKCEHEKFLDYYQETTANGSTTDFTLDASTGFVTYTTTDKQQTYKTDDMSQARSFKLFENVDVQDVYVELDSTALVFGEDYVKLRNNEIYLLENPGGSLTLNIYQRTPITDYEATQAQYEITSPIANHRPVHVTVDNGLRIYDTDFTVSNTTTTTVSFGTDPVNNAIVQLGLYYPVMYKSPVLSLGVLGNLKRIKHVYIYFDNLLGLDTWDVDDVNSSASQDVDEIIQIPKQRLNANLQIQIENDYSQEVQADLYSFYSLVFDETLFDISPSSAQFRRYTLFKEHLLGTGYSYALGLWSFDESAFTLAGWQITNRVNAEKYINIVNG